MTYNRGKGRDEGEIDEGNRTKLGGRRTGRGKGFRVKRMQVTGDKVVNKRMTND
jgi:hypothetical protein